eukprot:evm.model.scf_960EXC.4 EVM.evm.TU.scf_960EXC.4   scf_960EXC:39858-48071(+)
MALFVDCVRIAVAVTTLKLLLIPTYRSTDFEVHRNWLAITHSLPVSQWYFEETSEWTLDYPPLFAWFEAALAKAAQYVDPDMLIVSNLNYASPATIIFQRLTVIVSDMVLITAAYKGATKVKDNQQGLYLFGLVVANAGLLMVDHIHFQYNGLLIGLQLWSVLLIQDGHNLLGGCLFAWLLCMKHLFLFAAPVYFVYLLRSHCRGAPWLQNLVTLGACVGLIFGIAFGPFIAMGQLGQILSRMFPFGRGLCHAYWAPNAWALYACADKVAALALRWAGFGANVQMASMTGGLVGAAHFSVLPDVPPLAAMLLVLLSLLPCLVALWRHPSPVWLMEAVAYANLCGFVWGFHVHEKSILTVLLPLTFVAADPQPGHVSPSHTSKFGHLSAISHYSLLPLLQRPQELPIKATLLALHLLASMRMEARIQRNDQSTRMAWDGKPKRRSFQAVHAVFLAFMGVIQRRLQVVHLSVLVALGAYSLWLHEWALGGSMPFLPLMMTSGLCGAGIFVFWAKFCVSFVVWTRKGMKAKVL